MTKGPKFRRGYTWRHHWDEWWDRRPEEWKAKLFVLLAGLGLALLAGGLFWGNRRMEKNEILSEAKKIRQIRVAETDRIMVAPVKTAQPPAMQQSANLEVRSGE